MRKFLQLLSVGVICLFLPAISAAVLTPTSGGLKVTDTSGNGIPGMVITISQEGEPVAQVVSDDEGNICLGEKKEETAAKTEDDEKDQDCAGLLFGDGYKATAATGESLDFSWGKDGATAATAAYAVTQGARSPYFSINLGGGISYY
jgi:hypothetical protein